MDAEGVYWFPELTDAEIVDALNGWGIKMTPKVIAKPTEEYARIVCGKCVEMVFGITEEMLEEAAEESLAGIRSEYLESCKAAAVMNFYVYHMARFAVAAKISDFSSKDIIAPNPKRMRMIISAFVNFVNFYEQHAALPAELEGRSDKLVQERDRIVAERDRVEAELLSIEDRRAQDEPQVEMLRLENQTISANVKVTQGYFDSSGVEVDALKAEKATYVQEKGSLSKDMSLVTDSLSRKRLRIVKSPERIKRNIGLMGTSQAEERRAFTSMENKIRDLQTKASALLTIEKDVKECLEQILAVRNDIETFNRDVNGLEEAKMTLNARQGNLTQLEHRQERAQTQFEYAVADLEKVQRDIQEHQSSGQLQIEQLQREYERMSASRSDNEKEVQELREKAVNTENMTIEHMKQSEAIIGRLLEAYQRVQTQNEIYMETLYNKMGMKKVSRQ